MASTADTTAKPFPAWPKDAFRISFGIIWLIDAVLKWMPAFRSGYKGMITGLSQGQPGWLRPWFNFWTNLQSPHPVFYAYLVAVIETLIAVAIIAGIARKLTYISAAVFALMIWATAEGFGGPYTPGSSDIGAAVMYAVVFAGLLTIMAYAGTARYSADYYLEKKISWWWKVAEIRRPAQDVTAPAAAAITAESAASSPAIVPEPRTAEPAGLAGPEGPAASDGEVPAGRHSA